MKKVIAFFAAAIFILSCRESDQKTSGLLTESFTLTQLELFNKIKGGWAGQVIGCTFGGPTEFRFRGTMIQDYTPIKWDSTRIKWYFENEPGLYDDIYMDLTFVDVFEKKGLEAPAKDHGDAFAHAEYFLWHANQAARYNILNGLLPPESGYWENNPHADDIDFQIEADFAGLMSPGMPYTASEICDKIGHIMNYGDGWYGGVYVAAMYSMAFVSDDIEFIVNEALKTIPEQSTFNRCISDVIEWYYEFPDDWKRTWFEVEKKWSSDIGCPDGVFRSYNIDAKINAAYIVIGLLYGGGDFGKTLEISTRCGQDSDCNPASAGGILGTVLGYDRIPEYWKQGLAEVEDMDFKYTTMSLNEVYYIGLKHALKIIEMNEGKTEDENVVIRVQQPLPVKLEQGFTNCVPVNFKDVSWNDRLDQEHPEYSFEFSGNGFVVEGASVRTDRLKPDFVQKVEVYLDGDLMEIASLPTNFITRRYDVTWKYNLKNGQHKVLLKLKNPETGYRVDFTRLLFYEDPSKLNSE